MRQFALEWKGAEKSPLDGARPAMYFSGGPRCGFIRRFGIGSAGKDGIHEALLATFASGNCDCDRGAVIRLRRPAVGSFRRGAKTSGNERGATSRDYTRAG